VLPCFLGEEISTFFGELGFKFEFEFGFAFEFELELELK